MREPARDPLPASSRAIPSEKCEAADPVRPAAETTSSNFSDQLLPLVYDELRHLAAQRLRGHPSENTLQPTALVHEAWLRLAKQDQRAWNDRNHFFQTAALAMRHVLVDHVRQKASIKRGKRPTRVELSDLQLVADQPDERVLLVHEALTRLERQDPVSAQLVTLKFFGGFTTSEISGLLGVSERTLERQWAYARASLCDLIGEDLGRPAWDDPA